MKNHTRIIIALISCIFLINSAVAQESINTTGGNASGSGGSTSYSVGQVVYTTNTGGSNGSVAQGVQQPFEISVVTGLEEANGISLSISAYPNPTKDFLNLEVENYDNTNLSYQLFDISGKLIETKELDSNQASIVMSNLLPATYFVKVIQGSKEVKTFKIIKN
jgi:hypothetical protein